MGEANMFINYVIIAIGVIWALYMVKSTATECKAGCDVHALKKGVCCNLFGITLLVGFYAAFNWAAAV